MSRSVVIVNANYPHYEVEKKVLAPFGARVKHVSTGSDLDKTIEYVRCADAIMTRETLLPVRLINALENCRVIVRYGVGVDNIDLDAAAKRHIYVANVPDYGSSIVVSEHAIALMFAAARRIATRDRDTRAGRWDIGASEPMYCLEGKTVGVIGCGKIGRAFARKISALGFKAIYGYGRHVEDCEAFTPADLDTIFRECDVISLHLPLTPETHHLVNAERLSMMKPTAILINTSRGGLVDQAALAEALKERKLFAAGIDVFETEPPSTEDPLFQLDNVVVSDHTGWYAAESLERLQRTAAEEVARVFSGSRPEAWCNPWQEE